VSKAGKIVNYEKDGARYAVRDGAEYTSEMDRKYGGGGQQ